MPISSFENTVAGLLIKNIDKWYTGYKDVNIEYCQQSVFRYKNGGHGIVDLCITIYRGYMKHAGKRYNFEIKSCPRDLNSGNGMNLYGMYNYLVYPKIQITTLPGIITYEMVEKKLSDIGCDHAGIIGIINDNEIVVERKAIKYSGEGMPNEIKAHMYKNARI